jgi:peptidoglycan/LPS O-acetylase OafA/YrhL
MVLIFHFIGGMEPTTSFERVLCKITAFGASGVELFFVLSGFLITGILVDARDDPRYFRNFYMRRFLRIFPLYYGVLTVLFVVVPTIPFFRGEALAYLQQRQAWAWLYAVNVHIATHGAWSMSYLDHFWSLCVEEHFYLVWPLLVWLLARNPRRLMVVSATLAFGAMAARTIGFAAGLSWWTTYVLTPFRLDGLALGGFLALLARQPGGFETIARNVPRVALVLAALAAGTVAWAKAAHDERSLAYPVRSAIFIMLLATLLMWAVTTPEGSAASRFFRSRPLVLAGTYSYGLYVYHHFISYYMVTNRTETMLAGPLGSHLAAVVAQAVVGFAASAAIAYASYELFEKRFLALKRYFEAGRVPAAAASSATAPP